MVIDKLPNGDDEAHVPLKESFYKHFDPDAGPFFH